MEGNAMHESIMEEHSQRPVLARALRFFPLDKDTLLIRTIDRTIEIKGTNIVELITPVLEQLDGARTVAEVVQCLQQEGYEERSLLKALEMLHSAGCQVERLAADGTLIATG